MSYGILCHYGNFSSDTSYDKEGLQVQSSPITYSSSKCQLP